VAANKATNIREIGALSEIKTIQRGKPGREISLEKRVKKGKGRPSLDHAP